jgi:organic radical activating enzyme
VIQLNQQPVSPAAHRPDGTLEVHSVFYTIQGEGPFAGCPAVFVRLHGCNLQCPDCDTIYTGNRMMASPVTLAAEVERAWLAATAGLIKFTRRKPLVVITGGEPLRQNVWPFVRALYELDFANVQIETNGTAWYDEDHVLTTTIVCSPKKSYVAEGLRPFVKHLKYVVEAGKISMDDGLPTATMGYGGAVARPWMGFSGTVWLQPLDAQDPHQNKANIDAAVAACKAFGYRLSYQVHKAIGVD